VALELEAEVEREGIKVSSFEFSITLKGPIYYLRRSFGDYPILRGPAYIILGGILG